MAKVANMIARQASTVASRADTVPAAAGKTASPAWDQTRPQTITVAAQPPCHRKKLRRMLAARPMLNRAAMPSNANAAPMANAVSSN